MPATLDRPPNAGVDTPSSWSASPSGEPPEPTRIQERPPRRGQRSLLERYQQHVLLGTLSVLVIGIALSPLVMGYLSRESVASRTVAAPAAPATNLSTSVTITASEFKFSPANIQVPAGQKISFTLVNTGVVEHDLTIQAAAFTLLAKAGQTAIGEYTFDRPGVFDFFCSVPGHKDAGMKGTLTVVAPGAAVAAAAPPAIPSAGQDMSGMAGMAGMPGMSSAPASQP